MDKKSVYGEGYKEPCEYCEKEFLWKDMIILNEEDIGDEIPICKKCAQETLKKEKQMASRGAINAV